MQLTEEQRKAIEAAATEIEYMHADLMGRGGFSSDGKANPNAQALRELLAAHSAVAQPKDEKRNALMRSYFETIVKYLEADLPGLALSTAEKARALFAKGE